MRLAVLRPHEGERGRGEKRDGDPAEIPKLTGLNVFAIRRGKAGFAHDGHGEGEARKNQGREGGSPLETRGKTQNDREDCTDGRSDQGDLG